MKINQNGAFGIHNTTRRSGSIRYICIHYVGATGDARENIDYYNHLAADEASADFYVGHDGEIWQYNPDPKARYCWAVGGGRQSMYGGSLYGIVKNANSISVEMCVKSRGNTKVPNHADWYFTKETVDAAVELVKHLMREFDVPAERVVRHFDVTGKLCPGVIGWNYPSGSEDAWADFKRRIGGGKHIPETNGKKVQTVKVELPVLKQGMSGDAVLSWQQILNAKGYDPKGMDGKFGPGCHAATIAYQRDHNLTRDGKVGPQVYGSLWPK